MHHTGASLRASTRGELSSTLLHRSSIRSGKSIKSVVSDDSGHDSSNQNCQNSFTRGGRASLRASTRGELSSSLLQRNSSVRKSVKSVKTEDKCNDPISYHGHHNTSYAISPLASGAHAPSSTLNKKSSDSGMTSSTTSPVTGKSLSYIQDSGAKMI